ncbi:unnamed protein product [Schistosoma curassoni]|uniref:Uncharacterized protein n=1 Tax=Schistosoma curassoni TaxID=6186 RepID=A0A183JKX1_9TREM|nr:unnamed protein product [Schistosoma curassoni]
MLEVLNKLSISSKFQIMCILMLNQGCIHLQNYLIQILELHLLCPLINSCF